MAAAHISYQVLQRTALFGGPDPVQVTSQPQSRPEGPPETPSSLQSIPTAPLDGQTTTQPGSRGVKTTLMSSQASEPPYDPYDTTEALITICNQMGANDTRHHSNSSCQLPYQPSIPEASDNPTDAAQS
ncbi:hypothetical protein DPEC_G00147050 [Dallia pectoralis]|uniref:Uncharacterized protein n=1 Tax=Dallia pectoralis TaxID=75939 RepID=A0ACC2GPB1_DALPE|nr:hypothetical protein DPEC_G00147050 [Dallia pectoralis]